MTNKILNIDFLNNDLPDGCADLIIADPPYFELKGDFDFKWNSFDNYLQDVRKWAVECQRILKPSGSMFWWGDARKIAYSQVILDDYFSLLNNLVWHKKDAFNNKQSIDAMRRFAPTTERCLFYSAERSVSFGHGGIEQYNEVFEPIRLYIRSEIAKVGLKKVAKELGITDRAVGHWICKLQWHFPSDERIKQMQNKFGIFLDSDFKKENFINNLAVAKEKYLKNRRFFTLKTLNKLYTDILNFSQESMTSAKYDHPTQKPEKLTSLLIETTTKIGDLVVVPFAGSGTECAVARQKQRKFMGFEIERKYSKIAINRVRDVKVEMF